MQKQAGRSVDFQVDRFTRERWDGLWKRLGAKVDMNYTYALFVDEYADERRAYHSTRHISDCLGELDGVRALFKRPDEAELAIWFHDVVYNTHRRDNEARSADVAYSTILRAGLPKDVALRVKDLILATEHHVAGDNGDARLILDIDMSILGMDRGTFDAYDANIRKEYAWIAQERFVEVRSGLLKSFLDRPSIYATDAFREKYELAARDNLKAALKRLKSQPGPATG